MNTILSALRKRFAKLLCSTGILIACLLTLTGCNQSTADQFITINSEIVAGIQSALPIIDLFVPPPYNLLEPVVATLLNQVNTAAANIANAAASNGTALSLTQVITQNIGGIILDPTVIKQLPTAIQGPNGPVNTQALIQSLITLLNNELALAAHMQGATIIMGSSTNAINTVVPVTANVATAKLATTQIKMSSSQLSEISTMLTQTNRNAAVLAAAPAH